MSTSSLTLLLVNVPPPRDITTELSFSFLRVIFSSYFLKKSSPLVSKIFDIVKFKSFSISLSMSIKFNFNFFATIKPIELLPDPIIPKKTRFSFDFISFFIEKTQICLNLKITKVICNSIKIQVQAKPISLL